MHVLYSSEEIRAAVEDILDPGTSGRRVALVAYVGQNAQWYLPSPSGLHLVCALAPGSTDALELVRLKQRGVRVEKSQRLHMKVYWSERKGCLIGSANLTQNGLGPHGLKEAAVRLLPGQVDIDLFLETVNPEPITDRDLDELKRASDLLTPLIQRTNNAPAAEDFLTWFERRWPPWKVGWWNERSLGVAEAAQELSRTNYGVPTPKVVIAVAKNQVQKGDWLLWLQLPDPTSVSWMFVQEVVKVGRSEAAYNRDYPFQAVQVQKLSQCEAPPFTADRRFLRALRNATTENVVTHFENSPSLEAPEEWVSTIRKAYKAT